MDMQTFNQRWAIRAEINTEQNTGSQRYEIRRWAEIWGREVELSILSIETVMTVGELDEVVQEQGAEREL